MNGINVDKDIVDCTYIQEQQLIVVIQKNGTILLIDPQKKPQVAAEMPEQILAAKWSPNEEFLVIVSGKFVILLDSQLNPKSEGPIDDCSDTLEATEAKISWSADGKVINK